MSRRPYPHEVVEGGVLVVEAPSAEEALATVTERLGADARIVSAERVRRGGIAGFFAREVVQLRAARASDAAALARLGAGAALGATRAGRAPTFARALEEALDGDGSTPPAMASESGSGPDDGAAAPPPAPVEPATAGLGRVAWSPDELVRIGLPYGLIESVVRLAPRDDLGWVGAIAGWVNRFCGPPPEGPALVVGPRADRLARALELPLVRCPQLPRNEGTVCVAFEEGCTDLAWLARAQAGRFVHAVLGGAGSARLRDWGPKVVSWVEPGCVVEALRWCSQDGAVLGYGIVGARLVPAGPVDVALAIRDLVERR